MLITHQNSSPPRDPGTAPTDKKKKGKRRNQELAVQEGAESDDTTSMSTLNMGGEDSQDPLDNAVSGQRLDHWCPPEIFHGSGQMGLLKILGWNTKTIP